MRRYGLLILLAFGCVDEFTPPVANYQNLLVVEAFLTDNPESHEVKISRSYPINTTQTLPETGAIVNLSDGQSSTAFEESEPGKYTPLAPFVPIVGAGYTLSIATSDGRSFVSETVTMKQSPAIADVYFEKSTRPSQEEGGLVGGIQIYADATPMEGTSYLKYEWEDTWEFSTPYQSFLEYDLESREAFIREEDISVCWRGTESFDINIATNEGQTSANIQAQPIRFVPFNESSLRVKYSILVKQFALNAESYNFWKNLKESNESAGTLYDTQPFQIVSNISPADQEGDPVLGYFDMATESSQRIFIRRDDIPGDNPIPTLYSECLFGADTTASVADTPFFIRQGYLIETTLFPPGSGYTLVKEQCIDCRFKGSNIKPEFWE